MSKRALIMLLCCLVPMIALVVAVQQGVKLGSIGTAALFLLCPLGHILMMRAMGHRRHDQQTNEAEDGKEPARKG